MKQTFVSGLYASGAASRLLRAAARRPDADLQTWFARINAGEPYDDPVIDDIVDEVTSHHSSYYIDHSIPPGAAPDLERLDGRHLPARRGDPLLQPHPLRVPRAPTSPSSSSTTGTSAARTRTRTSSCSKSTRTPSSLITWPARRSRKGGVTTLTQTCGEDAPSGGPYPRPILGEDRPGRGPRASSSRRRRSRRRCRTTPRAVRPTTRSRAAAPARPRPAPTRPAPPRIASTPRRPAATR